MSADNQLWGHLTNLNKKVDGLISRVMKKTQQTPAISRELYTAASVEIAWERMPGGYSETMSPNSDAQWGNNIKRGIFVNKGSRLKFREMSYTTFFSGQNAPNFRLQAAQGTLSDAQPYFLWNFQTSITQRQYADKRISMNSLGLQNNGSHLVFREPFILEPMETLTVECELLQYGTTQAVSPSRFVVNMDFFGYREGM